MKLSFGFDNTGRRNILKILNDATNSENRLFLSISLKMCNHSFGANDLG